MACPIYQMAVLLSATQPLDAGAIAATFKQGRKATLKKMEAVLAALNNTGFLDTRDGGRTFLLRRAAAWSVSAFTHSYHARDASQGPARAGNICK